MSKKRPTYLPAAAPFPTILPRDTRNELQCRLAVLERRMYSTTEDGRDLAKGSIQPGLLGNILERWFHSFIDEADDGFLDALKELNPSISEVENRQNRESDQAISCEPGRVRPL